MNAKNIWNNIQERIALDNFRKETKRKRNQKRALVIVSGLIVVFAGLIALKKAKENN
jgi:hypothetical protein